MDYNLQKQIVPNVPFYQTPYIRNDQNKDFLNPGIGSVVRLFQFYSPLNVKSTFTKEKQVDLSNQDGFGIKEFESIESDNDEQKVILKNPINETKDEQKIVNTDNIDSNDSKAITKEQIKESFMHPRINVGSVSFAKGVNSKIEKKVVNTPKNDKFKFHD